MFIEADEGSKKFLARFGSQIQRGLCDGGQKEWLAKKVKDVQFDHKKVLKFCDGSTLTLHRFACVGPEDIVVLPKRGHEPLYVPCRNGLASLRPIYRSSEIFNLAGQPIRVTFKEIETEEELEGYKRLSDFHYRGVILHGRRIPIIATVNHAFLPLVVAYVELSTAFIMNKARFRILNTHFSDKNGLSWKEWDLRAMRTKTNLITRIARTVVYPELRGLGLSRVLLKHAFRHAAKHWQVAGLKPYFMEITADMLKYLPFAEKAGMHFIGYTEGNLKRLHKDMEYILKNYDRVKRGEILREDSAGIVDLQVSYAAKLKQMVDNGGPNLRAALQLMNFTRNRVNSKQYEVLHQLLRLPKPTYLKGLTPAADLLVRQRVQELGIIKESFDAEIRMVPLDASIRLLKLTLAVTSKVRQTTKNRAVQEAFGIKPEHLSYPVISDISLEIEPRSTVLIVGPSGSGKTLLLSVISGRKPDMTRFAGSRISITGDVILPPGMRVGTIKPVVDNRPIVELFGRRDIKRAIYVLNMAALSEAYLYLKRFQELSAGQQYRAMVAKMIDSERNVWIADEFCSALDAITAYTVTHNLKKLSEKFGATLVVAAPHWNYFLEALRPDKVVYLMSGREHRIFDGPTFMKTAHKFNYQSDHKERE